MGDAMPDLDHQHNRRPESVTAVTCGTNLEAVRGELERASRLGLINDGEASQLLMAVSTRWGGLGAERAAARAERWVDDLRELVGWVEDETVSPGMARPLLLIEEPELLTAVVRRCRTDFETVDARLDQAELRGWTGPAQASQIRDLKYANERAVAVASIYEGR